jgi:2-polyprenyl-3-methyl-5-hydroxy-6-metoxy-1,4-benzoquinol methylase
MIKNPAATGSSGVTDACPICGGPSRTWIRRGARDLRRCLDCRFAWIPQGILRTATGWSLYDDPASSFMLDEQSDYYSDESALDAAREKAAWVRGDAPAGSPLLDVGANIGFFVKEAGTWFDARGIEPSPVLAQWARTHLQAPVDTGSIYDDRADFRARFGVITLFDVIEHLDDPRAALQRCREYLKPGGRLFITTPDTGSAMARLLGRHWYYLDFAQHVSLFNAGNLRRLLADTGFVVQETRTLGRRYKLSYIVRRLGELGAAQPVLRLAHVAARPLLLWPDAHIRINLRDVMGIAAHTG